LSDHTPGTARVPPPVLLDRDLVDAMSPAWWRDYDSRVSQMAFSTLRRAGFSELRAGHANAITGSLPLIASPTPMVTLVLGYLAIVAVGLTVLKLRGQRAQSAADPRWLKLCVQVHPALQSASDIVQHAAGFWKPQSVAADISVHMQLHNVNLILLSAGMAASAVFWAVRNNYRFWGNAFKSSERGMGMTIYVFYLSKFYEFGDTVRSHLIS